MDNYNIMFESENIYYIKIDESLLKKYLIMYNTPSIQKNLFKKEYNDDQILNWVNKQLHSENKNIFSMIEKNTNEFIGNIEIICLNGNIGEIVISVTPEKQNLHYGTEAINATIKYGYEELNLSGFELDVYKDNLKAIRCYENVGFESNGDGPNGNDIHTKHNR